MPTRTGNFPIGFRRTLSDWQRADLGQLAAWAKTAGFEHLDLGWASVSDVRTVETAGLRVASCDLLEFSSLLSPDAAKRNELLSRNLAYIKELAAAGCGIFFTVIVPRDLTSPRGQSYRDAVEGYAPICQAIADAGAKLVIEGSPGRWPNAHNLCCTPETVRAFLNDIGSPAVGVNYDPSHLIRLGVDPLRFLREFGDRVYHVHAKDTLLLADGAYEYGTHQPAAFAESHKWGGHAWRYTLPGRGETPWTEVLSILEERNYPGAISIELEDEDYNGTREGERRGLIESLEFLRSH